MLEIFLAFIAGILTIAAPCILLPLPILLGSSVGQKSKTRPLFITLGFVITFSVLGITLNAIVQNLGVDPNTLRTLAVILLAVFALFMIWPTPFERLTTHLSGLINRASRTGQAAGSGNWGGFVMGVVIGVIWAPCAGPILGSILTLIAQEADTAKAFALLISYSVGAGLPMLAIAYGGQTISTKVKFIARYATRLQQVFGIILLLLAVAIHFQYDTKFQAWLVDKLPTINSNLEESILNKIENKDTTNENTIDNYGQAPEFIGISQWLNTEKPLTMQGLKGKVVLVDFWTYSCINCVRTLPYLTQWDAAYKDKGLIIIGVHTPEFAFEKDTKNVDRAIGMYNIRYTVAQDNDYKTWMAFKNRYWPAKYLIDANGTIVYTHFGEGDYEATEKAIRTVLGLESDGASTKDGVTLRKPQTPEIYFGLERLEYFAYKEKPGTEPIEYVIPSSLTKHTFALSGSWQFDNEKVVLTKNKGKIKLHFQGTKVYMVAASKNAQSITAKVDSFPANTLNIKDHDLYTLFNSEEYGDHVLEITVPEEGFEAYTFTFG